MDEAIRNRVRAEMERQGLDMKGLSKLAGLGETYVRDALKRGRGGSLPALNKLAAALGRSLDWLLTGAATAGGEFAPEKPPRRRLDTNVDKRIVDGATELGIDHSRSRRSRGGGRRRRPGRGLRP